MSEWTSNMMAESVAGWVDPEHELAASVTDRAAELMVRRILHAPEDQSLSRQFRESRRHSDEETVQVQRG